MSRAVVHESENSTGFFFVIFILSSFRAAIEAEEAVISALQPSTTLTLLFAIMSFTLQLFLSYLKVGNMP